MISRPLYATAFLLFELMVFGPSSWGREILDSTRNRIQIPDQPQRIVTLAPSLGELAADLIGNQTNRLIGVSEYSDYPPFLKSIDTIGPFQKVNIEKILALKPDLVLATQDGNSKEQINHLREVGVPVVVVNTENIQGIQDSILLIAQAIGAATEGNQLLQQLKTGIARIRSRSAGRRPVKVLFQVGDQPLVVAGGQSYLNEMLDLVGAKNVYADLKSHYPRPSIEDLIRRNPEVIVVATMSDDRKSSLQAASRWEQFPGLIAVQSKRVHILKTDTLLRPTLRLLEGLSLLERILYEPK